MNDPQKEQLPRRWAQFDLPVVVAAIARERLGKRFDRSDGRFDLPTVDGRTSREIARRLA